MPETMTFAELSTRAKRAGLPAPVLTADGVAVIAVVVAKAEAVEAGESNIQVAVSPPKLALSTEDYTAWADGVGGWQAAANWLNAKLGTSYTRSDTRRWGHPEEPSHRPIPKKVVQLLAGVAAR
ncbi:hypothetical protein [Azospirillum brasilense]|uniref:hypothetical protein n=1 Tax=Azospirillum brasilense TaxID=192 RepID=UPI001EDB32F2|nr:hypothetical protein [Azospirillum brasilense]UKJ74530.1 hypothetical protein H1Q64_18400 [Azospirillum brasilense]